MTPMLGLSLQLILVVTPDWDSSQGVLRRFERSSAAELWRQVGTETPIVVGRKGLAWGLGEHPLPAPDRGPRKREGDGKAPAGVFKLVQSFGHAPFPVEGGLPMLVSTASHRCVDDVASKFYNQIVDEHLVKKDWGSAEDMLRRDELYRLGLVVAHNYGKVTPGAGSCIFMHTWRSATEGTAGCTAMELPKLEEIVTWLREAKKPRLVQLPSAEYQARAKAWSLPVAEGN